MNKAVTLVEVITGAIILSLTFTGLLTTFVSVRKYVNRANKRIIAANLVVCQLNDLYRAVREDTWGSGDLGAAGPIAMNDYTIDNHVYQNNEYTVHDLTGDGHDYRRVNVTVNYPE